MSIFPTWYTDKWSADSTDKVWSSDWATNFNLTVDEIWNEIFTDRSTTDLSEWTNLYYTDARVNANSTVVALWTDKENVSNKSTNTSLWTSDTLYPTQNAVKTYVDNLPAPTIWELKKNIQAWENMNVLEVYRRWNTWIWEDETKFYKSLANNTDKLTVEWIVWDTVVADSNFDWIFNGIIWGFSSLLWQTIWYNTVWTVSNTINPWSFYPVSANWYQSFTTLWVSWQLSTFEINFWTAPTSYTATIKSADWLTTLWSISGVTWEIVDFTSEWIMLAASTQYRFEVTNRVWSMTVNRANSYSWWTFVHNWVDTWQDIWFTLDLVEEIVSSENDPVFLQDDWTVWVSAWTNEVCVWNIFSNTEINFINRITWKQSTTATTWAVVLWNAVWYITQNIPWVWNVKIPYYDI